MTNSHFVSIVSGIIFASFIGCGEADDTVFVYRTLAVDGGDQPTSDVEVVDSATSDSGVACSNEGHVSCVEGNAILRTMCWHGHIINAPSCAYKCQEIAWGGWCIDPPDSGSQIDSDAQCEPTTSHCYHSDGGLICTMGCQQ